MKTQKRNQDNIDLVAFFIILIMCTSVGIVALTDLPTKAEIKAQVIEVQTKGESK